MLRKLTLIVNLAFALSVFVCCHVDHYDIPNDENPFGGIIDPEMKSGIYLGICAFNDKLYQLPINELNNTSYNEFNTFVDNLVMKNGTLLYYSVEQALNTLYSSPLPPDISTVGLITFTDGLDQGSMMMNDAHDSELKYLYALKDRIDNNTVQGNNITAYCIGLRGNDVHNNSLFQNNLWNLSSDYQKAIEVTSMSEVNSNFKDIAEQLSSSSYSQTISIKIPGVANGTKIRLTFDSPYAADGSKKYIEGSFNIKDKTLENVEYIGLTSTSGSTVRGSVNGIFVEFTFNGVKTDDNTLISSNDTDEWTLVYTGDGSGITWQINSEFDKTENSEIITKQNSAVIMLVLDCSSSLGSQFISVQSNIKKFIDILYNAIKTE